MKTFVAARKGGALAWACAWHLEEVKLLESQIENLRAELAAANK
jgi:hypothetical protein